MLCVCRYFVVVFFFFKQKTAYEMRISDWSSDVCSSDLVTYADALAYAHWLGRELPSEAQWEFAAKSGRDNTAADRALRDAHGHPLANFWQGLFPLDNRGDDGYAGRAPVGCFAANPNGLYDMVGRTEERRVGKGGVSPCGSRGTPEP